MQRAQHSILSILDKHLAEEELKRAVSQLARVDRQVELAVSQMRLAVEQNQGAGLDKRLDLARFVVPVVASTTHTRRSS